MQIAMALRGAGQLGVVAKEMTARVMEREVAALTCHKRALRGRQRTPSECANSSHVTMSSVSPSASSDTAAEGKRKRPLSATRAKAAGA